MRPYQRGVVEQLGKYKETVDPGLQIIIPFIQSVRLVDMREQVIDVPPQEVITKDNVVVSVDAVIYYEPTDPQRLIYNVGNFILAITKLAQTNLRNLVGDMQLDEALTSRDSINLNLRQILDDATDKWGVRVVRVEIQRIDPPPDVMHSMHEQMKAERTRRAVVTEAEGAPDRRHHHRRGRAAGGDPRRRGPQAAADPRGRGPGRRHPGGRRRRALPPGDRGRGRGRRHPHACTPPSTRATPTPGLITIKYLEALQVMANGTATKIILPTELAGIAGAITGITEAISVNGRNGQRLPRRSSQP